MEPTQNPSADPKAQMDRNANQPLRFDEFYNVINGELAKTNKSIHGTNPSTLGRNPDVPLSTQEDVDKAVRAARTAAAEWEIVPLADRQQAVLDFANALHEHREDFALMLTKEQGKPVLHSLRGTFGCAWERPLTMARSSPWLGTKSTRLCTGSLLRRSYRSPRRL